MVDFLSKSEKFVKDTNVVLFWLNKKGPDYSFLNIDSFILSKPNFLISDSSLTKLSISAFPAVIQLENGTDKLSFKGFNRSLLRAQLGY